MNNINKEWGCKAISDIIGMSNEFMVLSLDTNNMNIGPTRDLLTIDNDGLYLYFSIGYWLFQWQRPGGSNPSDAANVESGDTIYFPVSFPNATSQIMCIDWESSENFVKTLAIKSLYLDRFIITSNQVGNNLKINQCGVISIGW